MPDSVPESQAANDDILQRLAEQQAIWDNATFGILISRNRQIQRANHRLEELLGYAPGELIGQPGAALMPSLQAYERLGQQAGNRLAAGRLFSTECEIRRKDDRVLWCRLTARAVFPDRTDQGILWFIEDISDQHLAQEALERAMQELYGILDTVVMGIALLRHRKIDRCNRRMEELFGFGRDEMLGCSSRVWYPDDATWNTVGNHVYVTLSTGREANIETRFARRDGSLFWGRLAGRAFDPADPYAGSVWIIEDITAERAVREELLLARKVFEVNSEAIMVTDTDNRIVRVNAAFEAITGYREPEVLGRDPRFLSSGRHDKAFFRDLWLALQERGHWQGEIWDRRKDGSEYPKWLNINTIRNGDGKVSHYVAVFSDITERKASEERIRYLAQHDALTGLPNRFTLTVHLEHALARAERAGDKLAVMFIDLDNFKRINDTLGHHVGDLLLCEVARRIDHVVRKSDIVARIGGDEFVIVLETGVMPHDAGVVGQKILDRLREPIEIESHILHCTPSIGVGIYPEDGADLNTLMKSADMAMYHAKSAGRNNVQFYADYMNQAAAVRLQLEALLRDALANDELLLNFQPQIDLASGRVSGLEALVRWQNAQQGLVSPATFIPLAEEIGLIVPIGEWVLWHACRIARSWLDQGIAFGRMAVNISPAQFRQRDFPERVESILKQTGLPPTLLELEITESTVMDSAEVAIAMLRRLKDLGVELAIDDFGTGYSSLAYLKRFPLDRIKIDRSFVMDIETDASNASIATAVIALAHSLGLEVVAEGVETPGQAQFLKQLACESVQGYFYCRPVPADEAARFCQDIANRSQTP